MNNVSIQFYYKKHLCSQTGNKQIDFEYLSFDKKKIFIHFIFYSGGAKHMILIRVFTSQETCNGVNINIIYFNPICD